MGRSGSKGFPGSSAGKESSCKILFDFLVRKIHWQRDRLPTPVCLGLPGSSAGKESACSVKPGLDPWVGKILWRREQLPTPVFWPGEFHGLYSP